MNDPEYPRISIVTPSYNQVNYIENTIKSVLSQSYSNYEYTVVDAGSSDGTQEILHKYRDRIDSIIVEPDEGQWEALVKGFGRATGDIYAWINADDYYCENAFNLIARAYRAEPGSSAWAGTVIERDCNGRVIKRVEPVNCDKEHMPYWWVRARFHQPGCFFSASKYNGAGGIRSRYMSMDVDLWIRLSRVADWTVIDGDIANCVIHADAKTVAMQQYIYPDLIAMLLANHEYDAARYFMEKMKEAVYNDSKFSYLLRALWRKAKKRMISL